MSHPNWLIVEIEPYLRDCPPGDTPIPEGLIKEIAEDVFSRFDFTDTFDQIDELARLSLKERGLLDSGSLEIS